ncbi:MAG: peptidase [Arizlama microvirus]|nr:MAG: peptidase [Arizlama microvirus]
MQNFKLQEFNCHCCGKQKMDHRFLKILDNVRTDAGIPFVIYSGYRCEKQNTAVGSTSTNHTKGLAADIFCGGGPNRLKIVNSLLKVGIARIGIHPFFVHCDMNEGPNSLWLY